MKKLNYAPGPWRVGDTKVDLNYKQIEIWSHDCTDDEKCCRRSECVAFVNGSTNPMLDWWSGARDMRQHARLIAAAPEMLEVLIEIMECADYWSEYYVPIGLPERIKNTIQKATGYTWEELQKD